MTPSRLRWDVALRVKFGKAAELTSCPAQGSCMPRLAAYGSLRWLVLVLTTWCLNSEVVDAAMDRGHQQERSAVISLASASSTVAASRTLTRHPSFTRDRCGCHQGTVLPLGQIVFTWKATFPAAAFVDEVDVLPSLPSRPDTRPPLD